MILPYMVKPISCTPCGFVPKSMFTWCIKELIRVLTSEVSQRYSTYLCHCVISASSLKNSKRQTKTWVELETLKLIKLCIPISKFNDNYPKRYET
jgi:hypothetical protein